MSNDNDEFLCPLCKNVLSREKWVEIIGRWNSQQKQIKEAEKEREALKKKHELELKKVQKSATELGVKQGIAKESKRAKAMSLMIQKQAKDMEAANKKIGELKKQLAEGTTPQAAGFDYEKEVINLLKENFPEDEIKSTGKTGDAIQYVKVKDEIVGSILYECKKTSVYQNSFVLEVKRHQETAKATYGVIVTHAQKKGKSKFFIEQGIIIIDPLGLLDIAYLLRGAIIEMHELKVTGEEIEEKALAILQYMQTGEFKALMTDSMNKAEDAYTLMIGEIQSHQKSWEGRYRLYCAIHTNIQLVRREIGKIIIGENMLPDIKKLPALPLK